MGIEIVEELFFWIKKKLFLDQLFSFGSTFLKYMGIDIVFQKRVGIDILKCVASVLLMSC